MENLRIEEPDFRIIFHREVLHRLGDGELHRALPIMNDIDSSLGARISFTNMHTVLSQLSNANLISCIDMPNEESELGFERFFKLTEYGAHVAYKARIITQEQLDVIRKKPIDAP